MYQAIKTSYKGPTEHKGSRFVASAEAGNVTLSYDYSLDSTKNHIRAAAALAIKYGWVKTEAEFRAAYVMGWYKDDGYFVDKKGGSLRHTTRIEYEIQGNYGSGWECAYRCDTMKEARAVLVDYTLNERGYAHRIKRVRVVA